MQAILPAPLYFRALQRPKNAAYKAARSYEAEVKLTWEAKEELTWWIESTTSWNSRAVIQAPPDLIVE